jgi:hypothetical protein
MTVTAHLFPSAQQEMGTKLLELATDNLFILLVATGTFNWVASSQAYTTVADFLTNAGLSAGGAVTEVSTSGTAYARQALSGVTLATAGLVTTLGCANPTWAAATITSLYAAFFDAGAGGSGASANDATTNKLLCYWDFGGAQASSAGTFEVQVNGGGLCTFTAS